MSRYSPKKQIKVALVSHSYLAEENCKKLSVLGKKVKLKVISPKSKKDTLFSIRQSKKIISKDLWDIHFYRKFALPNLESQYFLGSIEFNFKKFQPDIIHIEYDPFVPIFWQMWLAKKLFANSSKIVCTVKQNTYTKLGPLTIFKDFIAKKLIKTIDAFIAVNTGVASIYQSRFGVKKDKIRYITQVGVDSKLFEPPSISTKMKFREKYLLNEKGLVVGFCGRFVEEKGIKELVEGIRLARKKLNRNLELLLVGGGSLEQYLVEKSKKYSWLHVFSTVPHAQVSEFLKTLDIFVLPPRVTKYHVEHDAHALLEALSVGLPCIGTESGVIPEILKNTGIVIKPENPNAIANSIIKLCKNKKLRRYYGKAGRKRVEMLYSNESVAQMTFNVYKKVLEKND